MLCECADVLCPIHKGSSRCTHEACGPLFRVDMVDESGTMMCEGCGDDALSSGLFTDGYGDDPTEAPAPCMGCGVAHPYNGGECCR